MLKVYNPKKIIAFDLECTNQEPTHCFMWSAVRLSKPTVKDTVTGGDIVSLIDYLFTLPKDTLAYAHNLKYDMSFIQAYLKRYHATEIVISNEIIDHLTGNVKTTTIEFRGKKIEFRDSAAIIPMSLAQAMKTFTTMEKGKDIPLFKTLEEKDEGILPIHWDYCINDSVGLAQVLISYFKQNKFTLTAAGAAFASLKEIENQGNPKRFNTLFPPIPLDMDAEMRKGYRGALTFVNPQYQSNTTTRKVLNKVVVLDVNSMYPAQMIKRLPTSEPVVIEEGCVASQLEGLYDLGIQIFSVTGLSVKSGCMPFMCQGKTLHGEAKYIYHEDENSLTDIEQRTFYLPLEEFEWFKRNYDYWGMKLLGGWMLKSRPFAFKPFVDKFWIRKISKDPGTKASGKLTLNSCYGKFAESPNRVSCEFKFVDGKLRIRPVEEEKQPEDKARGYLPCGIFITSLARCSMLQAIEDIGYDNIVYGDTDSLHIIDPDLTLHKRLELHPDNIGMWDRENIFERAVYLKAKRYCGEYFVDGEMKLKNVAAGIQKKALNETVKKLEDFKFGQSVVCTQFYLGSNGMATKPRPVKI